MGMNDLINYTIDKYYIKKDTLDYFTKCKRPQLLSQHIESFIANNDIVLTNIYFNNIWPSDKFIMEYPDYKYGEFEISYYSHLLISRIAPVYYLEHGFEVNSKDPAQTIPSLDGYDVQPYTKIQQEIETLITENLNNFIKLTTADLNEVLCNIDSTLFGPNLFDRQFTVEQALFHDVLALCPE